MFGGKPEGDLRNVLRQKKRVAFNSAAVLVGCSMNVSFPATRAADFSIGVEYLQRVVMASVIVSILLINGAAMSGIIGTERNGMTPAETTLFLVYGLSSEHIWKTPDAYVVNSELTVGDGEPTPSQLTIKRNSGCRVEVERSVPDEADPNVSTTDVTIYDWSKALVDRLTVLQEAVPKQGFEAYYVTIKVPGAIMGSYSVRKTDRGGESTTSSEPLGPFQIRLAYAPGQTNAYEMNRQPFIDMLERCTGRVPNLPKPKNTSTPFLWTVK